jgi:hypothetical protein
MAPICGMTFHQTAERGTTFDHFAVVAVFSTELRIQWA